jgi:hypothetical protein
MKKIKIAMAIMAVTAFMLTIKSCKKVDNNGTVNAKEAEASRAAAIKAIQEKYGNVSGGIVYNINQTAEESFYKDASGKMVSINSISANSPSPAGPPNPNCQYNCSNTNNPNDLLITYTFVSAERYYICESNDKSNVFVKWTLSAPFVPTFLLSDNVPNTFCTVRFTPSSGSPVNYTLLPSGQNTNNFSIKVLGVSPVCYSQSLYEITCKVINVPNAYFQSNYTLSSALSLDVQCPLLGNVSASSFTNAPAFSQNGYLPCNRIDKVYIYPPNQNGAPTSVLGNQFTFFCTHPAGFTYIDQHQLEYRAVTSNSSLIWSDQSNTVYGNVPVGGGSQQRTLAVNGGGNLVNMVIGSGKWLVRYRNIHTSGGCGEISGSGVNVPPGLSGGNGNWGNTALWITEVIDL